MGMDTDTTDWLLDSDPALRWRVERDVLHLPESAWSATKARVTTEGFGARLMSHQDSDGQWAGGAYFPADFDWASIETKGQPWTATTWSLLLLREWGVDAAALQGTAELLSINSRWEYDDLPYWNGEVDCCINSWTLSNGLWLGADVDGLVDWFVEHQLEDGGWNCEWVEGAERSSFHSTLNALKGLLDYEQVTGDKSRASDSRRKGEEYLLERQLYRRLTTGDQVGSWATKFRYPFLWQYSILNAATYFRAASLADTTDPDQRMSEAIEMIRDRQNEDGTWTQDGRSPGKVWFEIDVPAGEPSKWLTFHATTVLEWWDNAD